jgi:hypothetical protein
MRRRRRAGRSSSQRPRRQLPLTPTSLGEIHVTVLTGLFHFFFIVTKIDPKSTFFSYLSPNRGLFSYHWKYPWELYINVHSGGQT